MLKKIYRGLSDAEVSELFTDKSRSVSDRFFHINWMSADLPQPQFVVITPKKLSLTAVMRNRLRRRAFAVVRKEFSSWTARLRIAIVVKKAAVDSDPGQFREHLVKLMSTLLAETSQFF